MVKVLQVQCIHVVQLQLYIYIFYQQASSLTKYTEEQQKRNMEIKCNCFSLIFCSFLLILIVYPNLGCLAARKLLDEDEAPSPGNNVTYESDTKNGAHGGITYVNGQPRSQSGAVRSPNGEPVLQANNHTGSQQGFINNPNGTPQIQASNTTGGQSGTMYGKDGKPQVEAHSYDNGTQGVTFYGSDGKPLYTINYQTPPGSPVAP